MRGSFLVSLLLLPLLAIPAGAEEDGEPEEPAPEESAGEEAASREEEAPPGFPATPPGIEDAQADYMQATRMQETFVPIRGQFFSTPGAQALGAYSLSLFLSERMEHDSNIYLSPEDETSDIILLTTAGGRLSREGAVIALDLKFAVVNEWYTDNTDESNVGGWLDLGVQYGLDKGFVRVFERLMVKDDAVTTTSQAGGGPVVVTSTERYGQTINDAGLSVGSKGEKVGVEASWFWTLWNYGSPLDAMDAVENRVTVVCRVRASDKFEWNVQGEVLGHEYEEDVTNSYSTMGLYVGGHWTPSPKATLDGRVGYLGQNSDDSALSPDTAEFSGMVGSLTMVWEPRPLFFVEGLAQHDILPSYGNNYQEVDYVRLAGRWEFRPRWTARGLLSWQNSYNSLGETDGQYLTVEAGLTWRFSDQWEATLSVHWQDFTSDVAALEYTDVRAGVQLSYIF